MNSSVQRFEVSSMGEAVTTVKRALGADALILSTRELNKGSIFSKPRLEVLAAPGTAEGEEQSPERDERLAVDTLQKQLAPLRSELRALRDGIQRTRPETGGVIASGALLSEFGLCPDLVRYFERMLKRSEVIEAGIERIFSRHKKPHLDGFGLIRVVGPTGVGKTTTLAKMCAHEHLVRQRRVVMVTMDTYRIGAIAQSKQYAELIGVPYCNLRSDEDLYELPHRFPDTQLFLVDTAGRAPGSPQQSEKPLPNSLDGKGTATLLAFSAGTGRRDLEAIAQRYGVFEPRGVIVTKTDETSCHASLLNASHMTGLPICLEAFGQKVPEDVASFDVQRWAKRLGEEIASFQSEHTSGDENE